MPFDNPLDAGSNCSLPAGGTNPDYTGTGYDYAVVVPADGGNVYVYDPTFCPVGGGYGCGRPLQHRRQPLRCKRV